MSDVSLRVPYKWRWNLLRRFGDGVIAARAMGVTVGQGCRVYSGEFGTEPWLVKIGDRVTISIGVMFCPHDGSGWLVRDDAGRRFKYGPITLGDDVFVGARAIVLPGVQIGTDVIIGAGSVVTRSVPSGLVVAGNPARVVGSAESFRQRAASWPVRAQMTGRLRKTRIDSVAHYVAPELTD